jgi:hypothetical protein
MIRLIFGIFLILHGLVHLLWLVVSWQITEVDGLPYRTTLFSGRLDLGAGGMRFLGLLWALGMVVFVIAGLGLLFSAQWWWTITLAAALYSLLLCIVTWPESRWGALINLGILALLLLGEQLTWSFLPFP